MELWDHVQSILLVLLSQLYAFLSKVSLVSHLVAKQVKPVCSLKDLFEFVLFLADDFKKWR
jgi:hypothetical protein